MSVCCCALLIDTVSATGAWLLPGGRKEFKFKYTDMQSAKQIHKEPENKTHGWSHSAHSKKLSSPAAPAFSCPQEQGGVVKTVMSTEGPLAKLEHSTACWLAIIVYELMQRQ